MGPDDHLFPCNMGVQMTKRCLGRLLMMNDSGWLNDESINMMVHVCNHVLCTKAEELPDAIAIPSSINQFLEPEVIYEGLKGDPQKIKLNEDLSHKFCTACETWYTQGKMDFLSIVLDVYERFGKLPKYLFIPINLPQYHWIHLTCTIHSDAMTCSGLVESIDYYYPSDHPDVASKRMFWPNIWE